MADKNYAPDGSNTTQFNPQLQHFDYICGQVMQENKILRIIAIIASISFLLSLAGFFYAISIPESIPCLVTMNDFGQTQYIGPVSRKNYQNFQVPQKAIECMVKEFLSLAFEVSSDKVVMNRRVEKIYHILTDSSSKKFDSYIDDKKLYSIFGSKTRVIEFETEPLRLSSKTYQIDFMAETRHMTGNLEDTKFYRAVITVGLLKPNEDDLNDNPLGIYITDFDIREINKKIHDKE